MGKYQKIIAKKVLSYDDLLVLSNAKKIKAILGAIVIVKHAKDTYLLPMDEPAYEYITRTA